MAVKFKLDYKGLDKLMEQVKALGETKARRACENALKETHAIVTPKAAAAISKYRVRTGQTTGSLRTSAEVVWPAPWLATIDIGFDISRGGLPSVFLMYGTIVRGTQRVRPDKALYDAFFGSGTKRQIENAQRQAFERELL